MAGNPIIVDNKLAAREGVKHALIDELITDYKKHQRLVIVCTSLKVSLDVEKKQLEGLTRQIELKEEKLVKMCVAAEADHLKKALRG